MAVTIDLVKPHSIPAKADSAAFEAIFDAHWPRVYAVLFRLTGDPDEAQDLALEVFWRLYERLTQTTHKSNAPSTLRQAQGRLFDLPTFNFPGWLYRVAVNLGYNALRSRKRRARYEQEAGALALETHSLPDPAAEADRRMERARVRQALARLKPRSAQILALRHSGLSYAEIAAALGLNPASVGSLLVRAEREFETWYRKLES